MKTGRETSRTRQFAWAGLTTGLLALGVAGCKSKNTVAPIVGPDGGDPAAANMAQPYTGGTQGGYNTASSGVGANGGKVKVLSAQQAYQGQASGQDYSGQNQSGQDYSDPYGQQSGAPIIRQAPAGYPDVQGAYGQGYTDAEEAGEQALAETDQAPPPLPEYDQPPAPDPNYLWTPGYYNYASAGYYWVPGAWVAPPYYGALWTPPWWGFASGRYLFHRGYWGSHVGFYGGIDYGFGYIGTGYYGGYWRGHDFLYNRAVTNVDLGHVHNVYDRPVVFDNRTYGARPSDRVDFNGGRGGIQARPNPSELTALHEAHYAPVAAQRDNRIAAASNRAQFVRADGGHPAMAFTGHPIGNAAAITDVPREQPVNHRVRGGAQDLIGRPEVGIGFQNGRQAGDNRPADFNGSSRPATEAGHTAGMPDQPSTHVFAGRAGQPETGLGTAGIPGEPRFEMRQGLPANGERPGFAEGRSASGNGGHEGNGQVRPPANPQAEGNLQRPAAGSSPEGRFNTVQPQRPEGRFNAQPQQQRPEGRFNMQPQRPAETLQQPGGPALRPAPPAGARPEAAPMQRPGPQATPQRPAPQGPVPQGPASAAHGAPGPAPRPGGEGGGEHGGHH